MEQSGPRQILSSNPCATKSRPSSSRLSRVLCQLLKYVLYSPLCSRCEQAMYQYHLGWASELRCVKKRAVDGLGMGRKSNSAASGPWVFKHLWLNTEPEHCKLLSRISPSLWISRLLLVAPELLSSPLKLSNPKDEPDLFRYWIFKQTSKPLKRIPISLKHR
jgi:hypothetical protein